MPAGLGHGHQSLMRMTVTELQELVDYVADRLLDERSRLTHLVTERVTAEQRVIARETIEREITGIRNKVLCLECVHKLDNYLMNPQ